MYVQSHTPTVVQGGGSRWNLSSEFLVCCSISKRFYFQWKTFDLLNKMMVVAMLEAFDVTNNSRHLGFSQQLAIKWKPREMVFFVLDITKKEPFALFYPQDLLLLLEELEKDMYVHSKMAWPPATYRVISRNHQSGPQPELDIWWRHPKFQHGAQTKGHDPGSLFSSLLHLEMTFSHSTLGVAPLNDEEALECEKNGNRWSLCVL